MTVQNPAGDAPAGAAPLHQSMHGCPSPASVAPASAKHGTSTIQLHGLPMHEVVLASWALHTPGSTRDGVVVNPFWHPKPEPEELPELELVPPLELPVPELLPLLPELDPSDPPGPLELV
jgi:hypothetical protein